MGYPLTPIIAVRPFRPWSRERELDCSCGAIHTRHHVLSGVQHVHRHLDFKTHMFRHAFIDRLKDCGDVPVPVAEAITGHGRNASEFARYGSVGYTLEQKKEVIERILV